MARTAVYSVVVGDNSTERLDAYLYAHTDRLCQVTFRYTSAYLLRTQVGDDGDPEESQRDASDRDRAQYLARYQTDRLASGLYGVATYGVTLTVALAALVQWVADKLTPVSTSRSATVVCKNHINL